MNKIFDCITFFNENFITNLRFEILHKQVDYFVICESAYDHRGNKKKLNFNLINNNFKNKIIYLVLQEPFNVKNNEWQNQAAQREYLFNALTIANKDDYIMFSDPDEIPNPELLRNFELFKKYGLFLQEMYCYKFNLYNNHESPWEGTRICKKKNLKSIDYMRQKIKTNNLNQPFWKFYKEKSIEVFNNGGWHFNSLLTAEDISVKLKTFAHTEFASSAYSDVEIIKNNIKKQRDLFKRNKFYNKIELDNSFPKYILKNKEKFKDWIL
jgi:beta-1,4-mannosyl-glycoprotein beta-1,4-N-acetylglucosaminyltransferase